MRKEMLRVVNDQAIEVEFCGALAADEKMEILQLLDLKKDAISICTHDLSINKGNCRDKKCFAYNMVSYVDSKIKEILSKLDTYGDKCTLCNKA